MMNRGHQICTVKSACDSLKLKRTLRWRPGSHLAPRNPSGMHTISSGMLLSLLKRFEKFERKPIDFANRKKRFDCNCGDFAKSTLIKNDAKEPRPAL